MNETITTIVGNVVDAPTKRTLDSGTSVTSFRVASTARRFDRVTNRWTDGESLFLKVTCWRALSDNTCASVVKGDPVIVTGRLFSRTYEVVDGKRASYELEASAIGFDFNRGRAIFERVSTNRAVTTDEVGPDNMPTGSAIDVHIQSGAAATGAPDEGAFDETEIGAAGDAFENASSARPSDPWAPAAQPDGTSSADEAGDAPGASPEGEGGGSDSDAGSARDGDSSTAERAVAPNLPRPPARRRGASPVPA